MVAIGDATEQGRTIAFGRSARIFLEFQRAYPFRNLAVIVSLLCLSFASGLSAMSILPVVSAVLAPEGAETDQLTQFALDALAWAGIESSLAPLLLLLVAAFAFRTGLKIGAETLIGFTASEVTRDIRLRLVDVLLKARQMHFTEHPIGTYANALGPEARRLMRAYLAAGMGLAQALQATVYFGIAFLLSWQVALGAIGVGLLAAIFLQALVRVTYAAAERHTVLQRDLAGSFIAALLMVKPLKVMARETYVVATLSTLSDGLLRLMRRIAYSRAALDAFQEPFLVTILVLGAAAALALGAVEAPVMLTMLFVFHQLGIRVLGVQKAMQALGESESAYWILRDVIDRAEAAREVLSGSRRPTLSTGISLEGVHVALGGTTVLAGLDLAIPARRLTVLTGPSGSGKSTILDLILAIQDLEAGRVLIDDSDLYELDRNAWRRMIGYVPQDFLLFNDSIRHNITLGDETVDDRRIVEALRVAGAWDFVARLPDGIDAEIGEDGGRLSGGERQRIMLARALIRSPSLLVLDEPTTALDTDLERDLADTLKRLSQTVTVLAVTHQPALQAAADVVWHIEGGRAQRR